MARTTTTLVQALLTAGGDYDTESSPSLTPFVDTATAVVDRVAACATARGVTLSTAELELVERWLAAHCYKMADQAEASSKTGDSSVTYQGKTGMNLDGTKYGQTALSVDYSGCLRSIGTSVRARAVWLGKSTGQQRDYWERNP